MHLALASGSGDFSADPIEAGDIDVWRQAITDEVLAASSALTQRQIAVDVGQNVHHALADCLRLDFAELEVSCLDQVLLLGVGQAVPEQRRLTEVDLEAVAARANLLSLEILGIRHVAAG